MKDRTARAQHRFRHLPIHIALAGVSAAWAQAPAEVRDERKVESDKLERVTVTATRRLEPVREVPMQINAVAADQLRDSGAKSLADYVSALPGLDLNSNGNPGYGDISMRGVTTGRQTVATVGVYVDDVAVGSSSGWVKGSKTSLDMSLLDLQQIEVLRGPQGTLYGAGAMGGLIKYVTHEPDPTLLSGSVGLATSRLRGGSSGWTAQAVVNAPLIEDKAAVRVAAFRDRLPGHVDAVGPAAGENINRGVNQGSRVSLMWQPTSRWKIRSTYTQQDTRLEGWALVDYDRATSRPSLGEGQRRLFVREPFHSRFELLSVDIETQLGWARMNAIASAQTQRVNVVADDSAGLLPVLRDVFNLPAEAAFGTTSIDQRRRSQELRLTSPSSKRFEWLAGYYRTDERGNQPQRAESVLTGGQLGPNLVTAELPSRYKEEAVYGNLTAKIGNWAFTAGARVAENEQRLDQQSSGLLLGPPSRVEARSADDSTTYLLTAGYKFDRYSSAYLRVATGYRSGGPNTVLKDANGTPRAPAFFAPDSLTSYEAGFKMDAADRRYGLELAAYRVDWKDVQQFGVVNGIGIFLNGGEARIQGAELVGYWKAASNLQFNGSLSLIDAKLATDWTGLRGKAGDRLPNSAKVSASFGVRQGFELAGRQASVGLSYSHVGERSAGFVGSSSAPYYRLPAYGSLDLNFGLTVGAWRLGAYVKNSLDDDIQLGTQNGGSTVAVGSPRSVGLAASLNF